MTRQTRDVPYHSRNDDTSEGEDFPQNSQVARSTRMLQPEDPSIDEVSPDEDDRLAENALRSEYWKFP